MIAKTSHLQEGPPTVYSPVAFNTHIVAAVTWLVDRGAQVITMSFGGASSAFLDQAIAYAVERGVLLVAASGNDRIAVQYPAAHADVIAVGGLEYPGIEWDESCSGPGCGTNFGPEQELVAPAKEVLSTFYTGLEWNPSCSDTTFATPGFGLCTGTSMSSPAVAGIAGLIRSANPLLPRQDVRQLLTMHASQYPTRSAALGYGVPDAAASVASALGTAGTQMLPNRLTPLFSLYSPIAEDHFYTTVPQMATAALYDLDGVGYICTGGLFLPWYPEFPGVPCAFSPCNIVQPQASVYLFTSGKQPFLGAPALVPLYRLSYRGASGSNPDNRDHFYTFTEAGIANARATGYLFDGVEGYMFPACDPACSANATCAPPGTVPLHRRYNPSRDDHAIFPVSELASMTAQGYSQISGGSDCIGYVYPNLDSDFDSLIDGFETLAGTDPLAADSDCDGAADGAEVLLYPYGDPLDATCSLPIATGVVNTDEVARSITLAGFQDPIMVLGPPSFKSSDPSTLRLRPISATRFHQYLQEWAYLDGLHENEKTGYLAVERGRGSAGSLGYEADTATATTSWMTVTFSQPFGVPPVVLAQVAGENDLQPVVTRLRMVDTTGFQLRIQEEEAADGVHAAETVHWIAIEPGSATVDRSTIVVDSTGQVVDETWYPFSFGSTLDSPVLLAAMQTNGGGQPAGLRYTNLTASGVQIKVEEEQSLDAEVAHNAEDVGWVAISQ